LNNKTDVGEETRLRVLGIVREQNYRRRVSSVKGRVVGVFFPFGAGVRLSNPYTSGIVFGAADQLFQHDYRIELVSSHGIPREPMAFLRYCTESNIEAALFVLSRLADSYIAELAEVMPVVATGVSLPGSRATTICYDAYGAAQAAVSHLSGLGHRRIGFLGEDRLHRDQVLRHDGFRDALREVAADYDPPVLIGVGAWDQAELRHSLVHILGEPNPPTALVVSNDVIAMQTIEVLNLIGIRIPEQLSIVGFDDLPFSRHLSPPLTTVSQPIHEIGRLAAAEIDKMLHAEGLFSGEEIVLEGRLMVRASTAVCC